MWQGLGQNALSNIKSDKRKWWSDYNFYTVQDGHMIVIKHLVKVIYRESNIESLNATLNDIRVELKG